MLDEAVPLREASEQLLFLACNCDEKKSADTKNEYVILRNLDVSDAYDYAYYYDHESNLKKSRLFSIL